MQTIPTIEEVKERANKIGVPIKLLCRRANIANSTFTRWQSRRSEPKISTYCRLIKALEEEEGLTTKSERADLVDEIRR
jgi:predicted transcriptional regulator